jgi:hypothetical protein
MLKEEYCSEFCEVKRTLENRYLTDRIFVDRVKQLFTDRERYPNFLSVLTQLKNELRIKIDDPNSHIQVLRLAVKEGILSPELDGIMVEMLRGDLQHVGHNYGQNFLEKVASLAAQEVVPEEVVVLHEKYKDLSSEVELIKQKKDLGVRVSPEDEGILKQKTEIEQKILTSDWPHASRLKHYLEEGGLKWLWGIDEKTEIVPDDGRIGDQQMYKW